MIFFERTNDVSYTPGILSMLKLDGLLRLRDGNILDYLTTDEKILERRGRVFRDTAQIDGCAEQLLFMVKQLTYVEELVKKQSVSDVEERSLYSIKQAELYFEVIDRSAEYWDNHGNEFVSVDFHELFNEITSIRDSGEYQNFKTGVSGLIKKISEVKSISVGFNFDASLSPYEAGILAVNSYYIESSSLIDRILRLDASDNSMSMAPLVSSKKNCRKVDFDAMEQAIYRALSQIFRKAIKQWEPEVNNYIAAKLKFLTDILPSLHFILKINEISGEMRAAGLKLTKPVYAPKTDNVFRVKGLYNPVLAIRMHETNSGTLIRNDFEFDEEGMLYIFTGPNNGGKSVFMSAVCIIQIMAQLGMEVPASRLEISPADGIFVHMSNYEGLNQYGRLADECRKISEMFKNMPSNSLCIFDETYSSTDLNGALELSTHLIRALLAKGVKGIFGTHFHELVNMAEQLNEPKIDYIVACLTESGSRTYHIERKKSDAGSDAKSIAESMGVTYEQLINS